MSNYEIEEFIIQHGGKDIERVCKECVNSLRSYLKRRGIRIVDIEDVVQDVMLRLITRIKEGKLTLDCSFYTFLYKCCLLRSMEIWRWQGRIMDAEFGYALSSQVEDFANKLIENEERILRKKKLLALLNQIGPKREKMLLLISNGATKAELQSKLGFRNPQAVADYKKNCRKKIMEYTSEFRASQGFCDEILDIY